MSERFRRARTKLPRPRVNLQDRYELFFSRGRRIDGLWIGGIGEKSSPASRRVEEALGLIKTYDRIRYDRLLRDLDRIFIRVLADSIASFNHSLNACQLDPRFIQASRPELIASVIVHEATHARLMRCGIGYDEALRARVERVCVRRERAFGAKLPNGIEERAQIETDLANFPADYWTNEAFADRYVKEAPKHCAISGCRTGSSGRHSAYRDLNLALRRLAGHLTRLFRA